ncbi:MAG: ABC transporter ATP-binding protein [Thermoplasmata archaeon]|nr:ABC transporter ATP-binding protein [Thermoplasmata archaeon]
MDSVWDYIKKYPLQVTLITIFSIISMISSIVVPYLNGLFIDALISSNSLNNILRLILIIIIIGLFGIIASYFVNMSIIKMTSKASYDMLSDTVAHIQKMPIDEFRSKYAPAYIVQRISGDLNIMFSFFLNNFISIFINIITLFVVFTIIYQINFTIFATSVLFIPVYLVCYYKLKTPLFEKNKESKEKSNHFSKTVFNQVNEVYSIKVDGSFDKSHKKLTDSFLEYFYSIISYSRISYLFTSLDGIIAILFQSSILIIAGIEIIGGFMTVGEFTIVNTYFVILLTSVKYYFNLGKSLQDYRTSKSRMGEIFSIDNENNGCLTVENINRITMKNVSFSYYNQDYNIIQDFTTEFYKGEIILIHGTNGIGKTTIANILLGLHQDLCQGSVEFDGLNLKDIDMYSCRQNTISMLIQNPVFSDESVSTYLEENIGIPFPNIIQMIKLINLEKLYLSNEFSIEDHKGDKINTLSGGQQQRIVLLKTLSKKSSVLILDEPSNGLDNDCTEAIIEYLKNTKRDRITIIISHDNRFRNISDKIIQLN